MKTLQQTGCMAKETALAAIQQEQMDRAYKFAQMAAEGARVAMLRDPTQQRLAEACQKAIDTQQGGES